MGQGAGLRDLLLSAERDLRERQAERFVQRVEAPEEHRAERIKRDGVGDLFVDVEKDLDVALDIGGAHRDDEVLSD